ncbi:MAG: NUDIX domain-containing protein [Lachnospiraceae bacterium]|nr:NUDIX domain-containing protein [Lachnospiraceae bacterium]
MEKPRLTMDGVKQLLTTRFINVFDLQYEPGKHYYNATRSKAENLVALKSDKEFQEMTPDAVSCFVIVEVKGEEPKLLLSYEFRYPTGQFLLSPPAGLIDPEDREAEAPALLAAKREILEETGLTVTEKDRIRLVNPLLFSSPGMTDESNALACAVITMDNFDGVDRSGAVGTELFCGYELYTEADARRILREGRDDNGNFFSVYTWCALMYFVSGLWKEQ